jgi:hypothetical protein
MSAPGFAAGDNAFGDPRRLVASSFLRRLPMRLSTLGAARRADVGATCRSGHKRTLSRQNGPQGEGGCVSQCFTFSMGGDHSYRLFSQTDSDGAGNDGSLNAPTGIPNRVEPVSRVQQTVDPQVGQKWWLIRVPASLVRVYILLGPSRRTVSLGKYAALLHGTPDRSWQS